MKRMTLLRAALFALADRDRVFLQHMAVCRGVWQAIDYARHQKLSHTAASRRMELLEGAGLVSSMNLIPARRGGRVWFLRRGVGRSFAPCYLEPKTIHQIMDGLLRAAVVLPMTSNSSVWKHNFRHASELHGPDGRLELIDAVDRAERAVLQIATKAASEGKKVSLHVAHPRRLRCFRFLMAETGNHVPRYSELSWQEILDQRFAKSAMSPNTDSQPAVPLSVHDLALIKHLAREE